MLIVACHGRLPRENNRLPSNARSPQEQTLADWLRYQRRPATRDRHCEYQRRRLEGVPGFLWHPCESQWDAMFDAFAYFVETEHRAPRYRATDLTERALAMWAAKQRQLLRDGKMSPRRHQKLESLSFRISGQRFR